MKNIVKRLLVIANDLDSSGHHSMADQLDSVATGLLKRAGGGIKTALDALTAPDIMQEKYSVNYPSFNGAINSDLEQINNAYEIFKDAVHKLPDEVDFLLETIEKRTQNLIENITKLVNLQKQDKGEAKFLSHNMRIQKAAGAVLAAFN